MTVEIKEYRPQFVIVQEVSTGKVVKYPRQFFNKRRKMGLIKITNPKAIPTFV